MAPKFAWVLLSAMPFVPLPGAAHAGSSSPLATGCYVIVDPKDQPNLDNAQEVLCVDASGHAMIRESSFFGEGVKGCNIVTVTSQHDDLVVDIDYRKCTNNSPSHQLLCRADAAGAFACVDKMGGRKEDGVQVKLAPLPPG